MALFCDVKSSAVIVYDARHISNSYSGLGRYTASLLEALLLILPDNVELKILFDSNANYSGNNHFRRLNLGAGSNVEFVFIDAPLYKLKHHLVTSDYVNRQDPTLYFYPHFDAPAFLKSHYKFVVHDLKTLILRNSIMRYEWIKKKYFFHILQRNLRSVHSKCVAVSYHTKSDLIEKMPGADPAGIQVVYEDSFMQLGGINEEEVKLEKPYLLYVGDRRPYKNLRHMINIFSLLVEEFQYPGKFYIVGQEKNYDFDLDAVIQGNESIEALGTVSDAQLKYLLSNMQALFFLSKYEGFGLPLLEAAYFNKKIITSASTSLSEIAPDSALLLPPEGEARVSADAISKYLQADDWESIDDYLKLFSWEKSAREIFGEYL